MDKLLPNNFYHIYNRGNNKDLLFFNQSNYLYFLRIIFEYMSGLMDVYAYCLLPNHFHFLFKTKEEEIIKNSAEYAGMIEKDKCVISENMRILFMTYGKTINKQQNRSGSLFKKYFQRKFVTNDNYLVRTILYIYFNPVHHFINNDFENYKWSSYNKILGHNKEICAKEVLEIFGGLDSYIQIHQTEKHRFNKL
jgi:putative transposase